MPIQSALALVGAAKQSAKGSPGANPTYAHGITDGSVVTVEVQQELESRTSGTRFAPDVNRTGVMPGMDFTCRAHPDSVGLWLYGALGAVTTTGVSAPYSHAITLGADLPYLTAFGKLGASIYAVEDFKVDSLELSWSENEPVEVAVTGMGCDIDLAATFTAATDDSFSTYLRPAGGTFALDIDGTSPAAAKVTGGSVSIANSLAPVMLSGALTPGDVFPGQQAIEVTLDVTPENLNDWRTVLTGTSNGTTVSSSPIFGSFELEFTDGTDTLTLEADRVAFTIEFPSANADGGPVTLSLAGLVVLPAGGGTAFTATLENSVASY